MNTFLIEDNANCEYYIVTTELSNLDNFKSLKELFEFEPDNYNLFFTITDITDHYIF